MVSVVSTIVSFGTLGLVFGVLHLWSEVPSAIFANAVGTVPSYYLNRKWAWGKSGRSHLVKEVLPFWAASLAGLVLSTFAAAWARDFTSSHHLRHLGATVIVLAANVGAYGVQWIGKFLIFNRLFRLPAGTGNSSVASHDERLWVRGLRSSAEARSSTLWVSYIPVGAENPIPGG